MKLKDKFEGVKSNVRNNKYNFLTIALTAFVALMFVGCGGNVGTTGAGGGAVDTNAVAATVNGKDIKMEQVDQLVNQKAQGQQNSFSPLELAAARLQVLDGLIQDEVLYQKAEKDNALPSDNDVTAELNRLKTASGKSAEEFQKEMEKANETEQSLRDKVKRQLAVKKLEDSLTGKIEPPKDSEIEAFYSGNKTAFVNKRGVKLAAIVIDPANSGNGDKTTNEQEAVIKGNELIGQLKQGADFATLARENSEDQSGLQGGDLGYISEEQMKQSFPPQVAATLMSPEFKVGGILPAPVQGKFYIFKLQERKEKDEDLTLESPGVREKVTTSLIDARKQLLSQSYAAIAMNDAKVVNYLAQKIVTNPNELSGARPAGATAPTANINANPAGDNTNAANDNANAAKENANTDTKNANAKPKNAK